MKRHLALVLAVACTLALVGAVAPVAETPDGLGEVDNVSHNDPLDVETPLSEAELDKLVTRAMARIELIRGLEFEEKVDVEVMTREAYRESTDRRVSESEQHWENLRWEALFVIGQERNATGVMAEAFDTGVQGFYSPSDNRIVVVTDDENATINKGTLVHELVHALQDQQFGLGTDAETTDARAGYEGLIEGEAELVPDRYFDRCDVIWSCVIPEPSASSGADVERGIMLSLLAPYTEGPTFVEAVYDEGGWDAVDTLYEKPPRSSAAIINPERYPFQPKNVTVPDRSSDSWDRLSRSQTDTLGELSIYAMFAHNGIIESDSSYTHGFSDGWMGDQFVPYQQGDEFGYVWKVAWADPSEAEQFEFAYRELLASHGALEIGESRYTIPDGPFEGTFQVRIENREVHIINAPSANDLASIHGS